MEKNNNNLAYISIIAVVAVVGIVGLIMMMGSSNKQASPTDFLGMDFSLGGDNLAGDAKVKVTDRTGTGVNRMASCYIRGDDGSWDYAGRIYCNRNINGNCQNACENAFGENAVFDEDIDVTLMPSGEYVLTIK